MEEGGGVRTCSGKPDVPVRAACRLKKKKKGQIMGPRGADPESVPSAHERRPREGSSSQVWDLKAEQLGVGGWGLRVFRDVEGDSSSGAVPCRLSCVSLSASCLQLRFCFCSLKSLPHLLFLSIIPSPFHSVIHSAGLKDRRRRRRFFWGGFLTTFYLQNQTRKRFIF